MVYLKLFCRIGFYCISLLPFIDGNLLSKENGHLGMVVNAYVSNWEAKAAGLGALATRQIQGQLRLYETSPQKNQTKQIKKYTKNRVK